MPRSHHCDRCGEDLTRVRALREPIYFLPLVRCGACGVSAVRRAHPLERLVHRLRVADLGLGLFATQLIGCAVATAVACACSAVAGRFAPGAIALGPESVRAAALLCALGALAVGMWLGLALGHLRPWLVVPLFMLWVGAWIAVPYAVDAFEALTRASSNPALTRLAEARRPLVGALMLAPIVALSAPLGWPLRRAARWAHAALWRRALRRTRARRGAT